MRDIFDTHVHCRGLDYTSDEIVKVMDENGMRMQCMIAPLLTSSEREKMHQMSPKDRMEARRVYWQKHGKQSNDYVANLAKEKPDRLVALCYVDQLNPDAPKEIERAVNLGCKGLKLFNIGHYPWDERCFPVYEKCDELGLPILFHSGILGDGRNSRFHRPAEYEIVKMWPNLKCLLAHISWPWTDEAIATAGMGPIFEKKAQIYIDLTPGAPLEWREDAEAKAISYLPSELIIFGTDNTSVSEYGAQVLREQDYIFDRLNVSENLRRKFYWDNAVEFWGLKV
ncbi:MAG: amidohydrolase family protein [Planctomycetota bacterium]